MYKFFLFLAFAAFALVSCSDEPEASQSEICAKSTKDCLVGRWFLQKVTEENGNNHQKCNYTGNNDDRTHTSDNLVLEAKGDFSFEGGKKDILIYGDWDLNEDGTMKIECLPKANCPNSPSPSPPIPDIINATIQVTVNELKVTSSGYTSFSRCTDGSSTKFVEVFSRIGKK